MCPNSSDQSTKYPFLPTFKGGASGEGGYAFKGPSGSWYLDSQLLPTFAKDMDVPEEQLEGQSLTAIPDIWARQYLFTHALIAPHHSAHASVLAEWRGLLGLICLAETFNIELSYEQVELLPGATQNPSSIRHSLLEMLPADPACKKITLIMADGCLVGASSPFTFVFTPQGFRVPEAVPWRNENGRLRDPMKYFSSRQDSRSRMLVQYLREWLLAIHRDKLHNRLLLKDADMSIFSETLKEHWAATIPVAKDDSPSGSGQVSLKDMYSDKSFSVVEELSIRGLKAIKSETERISDLLIQVDSLRDKDMKSPIVFWPQGWLEKAIVHGPFLTTDVPPPEGAQGSRLLDGKIEYPWINPEKLFFTDTIMKVQLNSAGLACKNGDQYLLPLRKEVFVYFSADFLSTHFSIEISQGVVTAVLRVPLSGGKTATVKRDYVPERQSQQIDRDAVALWPNTKLPEWEYYYLFARYPEQGDGAWTLEPLGASAHAHETVDKDNRSHVWHLDGPPEAILFKRESRPLGMIIPAFAAPVTDSEDQWSIAIDFGTTNTSVAFRRSGEENEASALPFRNRMLTVMTNPEQIAFQEILAENFMTIEEWFTTPPFPSVYQIMRNSSAEHRIFVDSRVVFQQTYFNDTGLKYDEYETRLKWDNSDVAQAKVHGFLRHLMILALAETRVKGIRHISMHWTYPSAFERKRRKQFDKIWREITAEIASGAGYTTSGATATCTIAKSADGDDPTLTESVAACQFARVFHGFTHHAQSYPQVTLDIGGGTTDIAVWLAGGLIIQTSVRFAGDQIARFIKNSTPFRNFLIDRASIRKEYQGLWSGAMTSERNYGSAINYFYRLHDQEAEIARNIVLSQNRREVKQAISISTMVLGALTFHAGQVVLAGLRKRGHALSRPIDGLAILYCGNGSRLLGWIGDETSYSPIMTRFLRAGLGEDFDKVTTEISFSKHPKMETCRGILHPFVEKIDIPMPSAIVGESGLLVDGNPTDPFFDLAGVPASNDTHPALKFSGPMENVRRFVAVYNEIAEQEDYEKIDEAKTDYKRLESQVQQALAEYSRSPEEKSIPSAFIVAMEHLVGYLTKAH